MRIPFANAAILGILAVLGGNPRVEASAVPKEWLKALHYEPSGDGYVSRIDAPEFFVSKVGRESPSAELQAFVSGIKSHATHRGAPLKCIMPFRYETALRLGLVEPDLTPCPAFDFFDKELGHDGASIVFVSQYADNPSSIMGHIFLQVVNDTRQVERATLPYLYKTVNYAAGIPPETNILRYIVGGIFGGFTGRYTLYEYAETLEKYNNMEARDIFVYRLNLAPAEVARLNAHLWELLELANHDYFFFDENCAFHILAILEAVRPSLALIRQLPFYTSPLEVLKILDRGGLVQGVTFTPSLYQRILDRMQAMSPEQRQLFGDVLSGDRFSKDVNSPLVAEALIESLNFRKHEHQGRIPIAEENLKQDVLRQRASLGPGEPEYLKTTRTSPHLSHGAARLAIGGGGGSKVGEFGLFRFRPAVHDILSRQDGFQRNSAISILAVDVRTGVRSHGGQTPQKTPWVESLQLAEVAKLNGTRVDTRPAWRVDLDYRSNDPACAVCLKPAFTVDLGISQDLAIDTFDVFALGRVAYRPYVFGRWWGGGPGLATGFSLTPTKGLRFLLLAARSYNLEGMPLDDARLGVGYDVTPAWDLHLSATYLRLERDDEAAQKVESTLDLGYSF